ncbi:hypothetical protein FALBO_1595 [Fusarium albosuccineum]|uniref:Uncharacterized protein n=1 Tax=Fusarium albosuccineum TaxID=1237068 RepID=A0A8H4LNR7_9HYPO|nr:hypothetical protein FALBO_1595 [Fusarium albosuccineum]
MSHRTPGQGLTTPIFHDCSYIWAPKALIRKPGKGKKVLIIWDPDPFLDGTKKRALERLRGLQQDLFKFFRKSANTSWDASEIWYSTETWAAGRNTYVYSSLLTVLYQAEEVRGLLRTSGTTGRKHDWKLDLNQSAGHHIYATEELFFSPRQPEKHEESKAFVYNIDQELREAFRELKAGIPEKLFEERTNLQTVEAGWVDPPRRTEMLRPNLVDHGHGHDAFSWTFATARQRSTRDPGHFPAALSSAQGDY